MATYDSDSSAEDELDVRTNVTLGYAVEQPTGDDISHVGGHPIWLDSKTTPPAVLAKCKICKSNMSLLLQLQADLRQHFPDDERRLFLWCCRKRSCSKKPGSIRALREVKKAKTSRKSPVAAPEAARTDEVRIDLGSQLFGGSTSTGATQTNPFASSSTPQNTTNPFSTSSSSASQRQTNTNLFSELAAKPPQPPTQSFADKLKISQDEAGPNQPAPSSQTQSTGTDSTSEPWPSDSSFPPPLPHFYLDAESEYLDPTPSADPSSSSDSNARITNLNDEDGPTSSNGTVEKDLYESPHDKTFDHFSRILSQNPEQILRYDFKGLPLLYSSTDQVATHFVLPGHHLHHQKVKISGPLRGIPSCASCGAARVFELQLVPYLIYELEKDNEEAMKLDGGEGMEWGTIIVGTCSRNCGDAETGKVVFREEWVGVQWEEGGVELKQNR